MFNKRPVCLVYSNDGFDNCAFLNLYKLYQDLGFFVYRSSRKLQPCDLLVVARGSDIKIPKYFPSKIPVQIYNYVGLDMTRIVEKIKNNKNPYIVFAASQKILEETCVESDQGFVTSPPVYPELWIRKPRNSKEYQIVHIGNKKTSWGASEDKYVAAIDSLVNQGIVDVWGRGWDKNSLGSKYHGVVSVYNIGDVYSRTHIALGIMYPAQRATTFSSRFWQAPINGAILLSEPGYYVGIIPGIFETDMQHIDTSMRKKYSRDDIAQISIKYWQTSTFKLKEKISEHLHKFPPPENMTPTDLVDIARGVLRFTAGIIKSKIELIAGIK